MGKLDRQQAETHYRLWFGGPWPDGTDLVVASEQDETMHYERVPVGDLDAYLAAAEGLLRARPGCNLYAGCCPQKPGPGRGGPGTVAGSPGLWWDVDTLAGPHAASRLPGHDEGLVLATQACAAVGLDPMVVETGGGWHLWLPGTEPLAPAEGRLLMAAWRRHVAAMFERSGFDADVAPLQLGALLRVPGSWRNKPGGEPTRVELRQTGTPCDLATLADRLPPPPRRPAPKPDAGTNPFRLFDQRVEPAELLDLLGAALVREGGDGARYWRLEPTSSPFSLVTHPPGDDGSPGWALVVGGTLGELWSTPKRVLSAEHSTTSTGILGGICRGDSKLLRRLLAVCGDGEDIAPLEGLLAPIREAGTAEALTHDALARTYASEPSCFAFRPAQMVPGRSHNVGTKWLAR